MAKAIAAAPAVPSMQTRRRAGLSRLLRPRIAATLTAGALVLSFGGLAQAGVLPAPLQHAAHVAFSTIGIHVPDRDTSGVVVPASSSAPSPLPVGSASPGGPQGGHSSNPHRPSPGASPNPTDVAAARGLCNAWARGKGGEHGNKLSATAFKRLQALAGQQGVAAYCAGLGITPGGRTSPNGKGSHGGSRGGHGQGQGQGSQGSGDQGNSGKHGTSTTHRHQGQGHGQGQQGRGRAVGVGVNGVHSGSGGKGNGRGGTTSGEGHGGGHGHGSPNDTPAPPGVFP